MNSHPTLPFDAHTLARTSNPSTSHAAARACRELRSGQHEEILRVLMRAKAPLTACEIADYSDGEFAMDKHQVGRRCVELVRAGYVEVADEAGITNCGRRARRYRIAGGGDGSQ